MSQTEVTPNDLPDHSPGELWELGMGLYLPEGATYERRASSGYLVLDETVPYPDEIINDLANNEIFLKGSLSSNNGKRIYLLPNNSSTLSSILNEAAGTTDSFDVEPSTSRTLAIINKLFSSVVSGLANLRDESGMIPKSLPYYQVLVEKNSKGHRADFKLLPPLTLERPKAGDMQTAWLQLSRTLITSMLEGCDTDSQRQLVEIVKLSINTDFLRKNKKIKG